MYRSLIKVIFIYADLYILGSLQTTCLQITAIKTMKTFWQNFYAWRNIDFADPPLSLSFWIKICTVLNLATGPDSQIHRMNISNFNFLILVIQAIIEAFLII